jgi:hypothetical protein
MPTVGWIQEGDIDRMSDAFPFKKPKKQPVHCQLCGKAFFDADALKTHLGVDHPLKQPIIQLGREVGTQFVVRDPAALGSVTLFNTTDCTLTEGAATPDAITPDALVKRLSKARNTSYRVLLRNERLLDGHAAEVEVLIRVAIPDAELCAKVEGLFTTLLAVERPTVEAVARFLHESPNDPAIRDYAGALADYVLGILIKEQDASAGAIAEFPLFKSKLSSARHVLNHFHGPLAEAVLAAIDFNLNNFWPDAVLSVPALEAGHRFFTPFFTPAHKPSAPTKKAKRKIAGAACPVDHLTNGILRFVDAFPSGPEADLEAGLAGGTKTYPVSEFDRTKISTLLAAAAILAGDKPKAVQQLRRLVHDYHFGAWATKQLENLASND